MTTARITIRVKDKILTTAPDTKAVLAVLEQNPLWEVELIAVTERKK